MAATFMIIGNEIRRFIKLRDWTFNNTGLDLGALLGMGMILLALSEMNGYTDIASDSLGSVWIYLLTGVIGTYIMFAGSTGERSILQNIYLRACRLSSIVRMPDVSHPLSLSGPNL